ncbi:MAG TPA: 16S rRNA (guanine(966)-N(2))-methyltransferase RsmD [Blastocatellia bacterium]|nr:16S rRNA (guanine(966)-N(2))-methyltransferase RsmD [Blastocatellia bacterium]
MRVIGGKYRGRRLKTVEGLAVRPTSDRLRETLFNIIAPQIKDSRFLDLCAGSGAVGIEALSRGASHVTFVDQSRRACSAIQVNLDTIGITSKATIITKDAVSALKQLTSTFDIIFFDPPYESDAYDRVLRELGRSDLPARDAIVVVEHRAKRPPEQIHGGLEIFRTVKQGESSLAFFRLAER